MDAKKFLEIVHFAERLKDVTRHAYTSGGRHESVAEHSWRLCLMAFFLRDEFPDTDMDKVVRMCMIHDLGEIFTGDIPTFLKPRPTPTWRTIRSMHGSPRCPSLTARTWRRSMPK